MSTPSDDARARMWGLAPTGLNAVERGVVCGVGWLLLRPRLVAWIVTAVVVLWLASRLLCALGQPHPATTPHTTLYDPDRLQRALHLFAETGAGAPASSTETRLRTERLCRDLLERMLGFPLPKARPRWLLNPTTNRCLELDLYSEPYRLAFEVDGAQHEVYTPHFHGTRDQFEYRRLLDRLKNELCHEHGVQLIRIPYHEVSVADETRTARYLQRLLRTHGLPFQAVVPEAEA